jgi:ABC-type Mn2+/Zn2+ transport system ATPase subunit
MPHFDIIKTNTPKLTFRTSKIQADYDVQFEHSSEHFVGDFDLPDEWSIGIIVGGSGTGKTTIAKEIFKSEYVKDFEYTHESVVDDMPKGDMKAIERMFYAVGFGSVPSWLKPYNVLSNGEKMRVDLARALLENDTVCFDEFTSVVDRRIAQTMCIATNKAIKRTNRKFVAITCHYDVLNWLEADWIFDTDTMKMSFPNAHDRNNASLSDNVGETNGESLGDIII